MLPATGSMQQRHYRAMHHGILGFPHPSVGMHPTQPHGNFSHESIMSALMSVNPFEMHYWAYA